MRVAPASAPPAGVPLGTPPGIPLGGDLTIARAAELRERLLARLAEAPPVLALDLGEVADFDSAGIQLLLAARRTQAQAGARLVVIKASAPVRDAVQLFGLDSLLELPHPLQPAAEGAAR